MENRSTLMEDFNCVHVDRSVKSTNFQYREAFSENNEDIGRTKFVKIDIDTGDSLPVSSRPYTLPLKHYECTKGDRIARSWFP